MRARQIALKMREDGALYRRKTIGEYQGQVYWRPNSSGWQVCAAIKLGNSGQYDLSQWLDAVFNCNNYKVMVVYKL